MFLSAVSNKRIQLIIAIMTVVVATALEELVPPFFFVGMPFLLASVMIVAPKRSAIAVVFFAVAAGSCEDAVSSLPPLTSVGFFLAAAFAVRNVPTPKVLSYIAYPLYQLYLAVWIADLNGGVFVRTFSAFFAGALAVALTTPALSWLDRKAGVDEQG